MIFIVLFNKNGLKTIYKASFSRFCMAFLKKPVFDEKVAFPRNQTEATELILETFSFNKWNNREQETYLAGIGIDLAGREIGSLSKSEQRKILLDLQKSRMILFKN